MAPPETPKDLVYPLHVRDAWGERLQRRYDAETADAYRRSLRKFVVGSWNQVEPAKRLIPSFHIDAIADHVQAAYEGKIQNLLITVPPGSAKSVIVSVDAPAWAWTWNPGFRSTFLSYDDSLSTRDSVRCRDLMQSAWYQETFQPQWKFASDQNEKTYYVNSAKGFRVSGKGTGWRSLLLTYDDPLNAQDRFSDLKLAKVIDDWENVLFNRFVDLPKAIRIIIMQRLTDRDLAGHVLRKGGVEHLKIALEYDPSRSRVTSLGWKDPRKPGEIMCPELFPPSVVAGLKENSEAWWSQYQQEPTPDGGGILKSHKWNYWQPPGANLPPVRVKLPDGSIEERAAVPLPAHFDIQLQSWDLTFTDSERSDLVCGQVHGVRGAQRFILDQDMRRMGVVETMNAIRVMSGRWPQTHLKLVEKAANASAVVEMLEKEISGLTLEPPIKGKVARAAASTPELEAGNWFLPHPMLAPWVGNPENPTESGFIASTVLFPFGNHDDDVDSWSMGALRLQKERLGGEFSISDQDIRVDQFEIDPKWPRLYGLAIDWREFGAVWIARKPETETCYLYNEYFAPSGDPALHVSSVKKAGEWIQGAMHPDEVGRDEQAGYALMGRYSKLGLNLFSVPRDVAAEITDLQEALRSGKLKVLGNLGRFFDQFLCYRRDTKGKLPEQNTALIRAMMVAWRARDKMRGPALPPKPQSRMFLEATPGNGWMRS